MAPKTRQHVAETWARFIQFITLWTSCTRLVSFDERRLSQRRSAARTCHACGYSTFYGSVKAIRLPDEVFSVVFQNFPDVGRDAGHDAHAEYDVDEVGQLYAELRQRTADWTHAEWNDVHESTCH